MEMSPDGQEIPPLGIQLVISGAAPTLEHPDHADERLPLSLSLPSGSLVVRKNSIGLIILSGALVISGWACRDRVQPRTNEEAANDPPRLTDYAGWQKCAQCHAEITDSWLKTGHARTFLETWNTDVARHLDGRSFTDAERHSTFRYSYDPADGLMVTLPGQFGNKPFPLEYLLGSNHHAQTFLTLIPHQNGETVGIEHRVSLFGDELDLTPSHQDEKVNEAVQAFGQVQDPQTADRCIGCHTTFHRIREHRLQQVIPNVQCEACHGPGAGHVRSAESGGTTVSLSSLSADDSASALRQIKLCGTCHRLPADVPAELIRPDYRQLARFQPIGLMESNCFKKSGGRLACSHCHNPHQPVSARSTNAVEACLNCHRQNREDQVACPTSPTTDCVRCHMPQIEVHPRVAFHDHWIRVHREPSPSDVPPATRVESGEEPVTGRPQ
jgi:hypothetical protein